MDSSLIELITTTIRSHFLRILATVSKKERNLGNMGSALVVVSETSRLRELGGFLGDQGHVTMDTIVVFTLRWNFRNGDVKKGRKGNVSKHLPLCHTPFHPINPVAHSLAAADSRKHHHDGA